MSLIPPFLADWLSLVGLGGLGFGYWSWRRNRPRPAAGAPETVHLSADTLDRPEAFSQTLVETASDIIYVLTRDGRLAYLNPVFELQTGWTPAEWIGRPFFEMVHPDDLAQSKERIRRLGQGEILPLLRMRIKTRSGDYRTGEFKTVPLKQHDRVIGMLGIATDVTPSQRLEEALRASERFLESIFESIQDGISILDKDLTILRVNATMERWYAHTMPLVGKKCYEAYHQRTAPCEICPSRKTLATGESAYERVPKTGPGGRVVGAEELYTFPFTDLVTGELQGVIEFVRDITPRVRAEEALRDSLQTSADIMHSLPIGIFIYQFRPPDKLILIDANEEAKRSTGMVFENVRGKEMSQFWPHGADLKKRYLDALQHGQIFSVDDYFYQGADFQGYLKIRAFGLPGQRLGVAVEDVSEARKAEEARRRAEEKFHRLVELSLVGIYIIRDFRFEYVNPKLADIFGYTPEEMLALPAVMDVVGEEDRGQVMENLRRRLQGEIQSIRYSFRGKHKDGRRIEVEVHGHVMEESGQRLIIGTLLETTEAKRLEEQLRQAQKMEAVGRLAGGVAHDFNNLLMAIMGYSELLLTNMGPEDSRRHEADEILKAARRGAALTRQLLAYSRRQMLHPIVLSLNSVVRNLEPMLGHLIGEDIELHCDLDEAVYSIKADPGNLEQVIMNLAVNARDAMPSGGRLQIKTENVDVREGENKPLAEMNTGAYVCLTVADTGVGMEPETVQRIFEPFFSTKEIGQGTGLGLAVVYGIVKQHNGWIQLQSSRNQGTTFRIFLPAFSQAPAAAGDSFPDRGLRRGKGECILLVEDEEQVRTLAARALTEQGYAVLTAVTAAEALKLFAAEQPRVALVFSDVVLADRSGLHVVEEIRRMQPEVKVILSSGYAEHKAQWPLIQTRGYAFLQKPYSLREMLLAVGDVLAAPSA
jgi:two-component system, cell cycle sensor histidine kinase and response regulator CckA